MQYLKIQIRLVIFKKTPSPFLIALHIFTYQSSIFANFIFFKRDFFVVRKTCQNAISAFLSFKVLKRAKSSLYTLTSIFYNHHDYLKGLTGGGVQKDQKRKSLLIINFIYYLSIYLYQGFNLYLSFHLCYLLNYLPVKYPPNYTYMYLAILIAIYLLSIYLSISNTIYLSIYVSIYVSLSCVTKRIYPIP